MNRLLCSASACLCLALSCSPQSTPRFATSVKPPLDPSRDGSARSHRTAAPTATAAELGEAEKLVAQFIRALESGSKRAVAEHLDAKIRLRHGPKAQGRAPAAILTESSSPGGDISRFGPVTILHIKPGGLRSRMEAAIEVSAPSELRGRWVVHMERAAQRMQIREIVLPKVR